MGQYYRPIILAEKVEGQPEKVVAHVFSHDYGSGLKLMEHSWRKNPFVMAFETLIEDKPQRVVWAGDYAGPEQDQTRPDRHGNEEKVNLYGLCDDDLEVRPETPRRQFRFVINHTKKLFVDKSHGRTVNGWQIHPLPLLTCEGNGEGGGDFRDTDLEDLVGSWARDVISVSHKKPKGEYKEIIFDLIDSRF